MDELNDLRCNHAPPNISSLVRLKIHTIAALTNAHDQSIYYLSHLHQRRKISQLEGEVARHVDEALVQALKHREETKVTASAL